MENLNSLATDKVMSLAELKEDNLYSKIGEDSLGSYIEESMDIGTKSANKLKREYPNKSVKEICQVKGIDINLIEDSPKFKFVKIRAEYLHYKRQLNIYNNSIEDMAKQFQNLDMKDSIDKEDIIDIHISHELFHFLEYEEIGLTNAKLKPVKIFGLFNRERTSTIINTREIAAHMFCKEMLNLDIHPKWIDYLYLLGAKEISYEDLEKYLLNLNEEVSNIL